jgi:hypothetical protein
MKNVLSFQYLKRNQRLKNEGFSSYQEYLKSPTWKAIKLKIRVRQEIKPLQWGRCQSCFKTKDEVLLVPHHMRYKLRGTSLGSLIMVCQSCHEKIHSYHREHPKQSLKQATRKFCKKVKKQKL